MRHILRYSLGCLVVLIACENEIARSTSPLAVRAESSPGSAGYSLTGSGKLDLTDFDPSLRAETYAFAVFSDANGEVKGQIEIHLSDPAVAFHADATCLAVQENLAWVGGVITHSGATDIVPEGTTFWLRLQDNGEGRGSADRVSFVRLGVPAENCNFKRSAALPLAFSGGNLRIR